MAFADVASAAGVDEPAISDAHEESTQETASRPPESVVLPRVQQAQALFAQGVTEAGRGDWQEARDSFVASLQRYARPSTLFNLALCEVELEEWVAAHGHVHDYLAMIERDGALASTEEVREAHDLQAVLERKVALLRVRTEPRAAEVRFDGALWPTEEQVTALPGEHHLLATAEGFEPLHRDVRLTPGVQQVGLVLNPIQQASAFPHVAPPAALQATKQDDTDDSLWSSPWLWGVGGVVVVAAGVVALALATSSDDHPATYAGTTGIRL